MGDLTRSRRWHDLRRSIAIGGIGLWFLLGGLPLAALGIWWSRGEQLAASPVEIVLQFVLPAALQTASAVCAIGVLAAKEPQRARPRSWWQIALLLLSIAVFLGTAAAFH
jgi:hypothetical protein